MIIHPKQTSTNCSFRAERVTYPVNLSLKMVIPQIPVTNFRDYYRHLEIYPAFGCCIVADIYDIDGMFHVIVKV